MIGKAVLFAKIGFYTFYMPVLETRYGLKELFSALSRGKERRPHEKDIIRRYVRVWMGIKGRIVPQHCWNRTLLLYRFLKTSGYDVAIYTGLRKDSIGKASITGHSWITVDGRVFDDREDVTREYYVTFSYP